ncbi:hypothetical protein GCM10020255_025250 [Rhodococcus baikonurensis]
MRDNTAMKKKARARAQATGEKYVTAQKQIAAQAPEPVAPRFPAIATLPSPTRIPTSIDEASEMYPTFRMQLGIDESGDIVGVDLAKNPHALFFGATGSGKSVLTRTVIESCRSAGWMIFLCDGKGTDYEALHRQPGIAAISQRAADHMRMVRMVADELRGRQADAWERRQAGERGPFPRPPLLLLLDEYATIRASIRDEYGTDFHEFDSDVQHIARIGREFRVHVIVATQDPSPRTIPAPLLENLSTRVALGPADNAATFTAFPILIARQHAESSSPSEAALAAGVWCRSPARTATAGSWRSRRSSAIPRRCQARSGWGRRRHSQRARSQQQGPLAVPPTLVPSRRPPLWAAPQRFVRLPDGRARSTRRHPRP